MDSLALSGWLMTAVSLGVAGIQTYRTKRLDKAIPVTFMTRQPAISRQRQRCRSRARSTLQLCCRMGKC